MKKSLFLVSIIAVAMLTSCGNSLPQPEQINVNPSPLAVVGNKVNADITGTFPVKKFNKKGILTVTPVLKFDGRELEGEPVVYVGEKVKENGTVVNFKEGGKYSQSCSFDYDPAMSQSELYLRFSAKVGKKEIEVPEIKIADGLVETAKLAQAEDNQTVLTTDKFQRIIQEMQEADIKFLIQQANLRSSETGSQSVKDLQAAIKDANNDEKKAINKLEVSGYASPDGGMELNTKLAQQRQQNTQKFLQNQMKKDKVNAEIEASTTAEDWDGFQKAMQESNIQDKDLVIRVLGMYSDPEERETQIKNLSNVYKNIANDVLPALRRSRLILTTDLIGKSDEEIQQLFKEDPSQLNKLRRKLSMSKLLNSSTTIAHSTTLVCSTSTKVTSLRLVVNTTKPWLSSPTTQTFTTTLHLLLWLTTTSIRLKSTSARLQAPPVTSRLHKVRSTP